MITVFSAMRPFVGSIGQVQQNAVRSWLSVRPRCQVVLIDDEEGTTPAAVAGLGVDVVREVKRSRLGAPLLDDLLRVGAEAARGDLMAFNTADVLLPGNFASLALDCHRLMDGRDYFASGARVDLLRPVAIDFDRPDWFGTVQSAVKSVGKPRGHTALDLWVYPKSLRWDAPPMPIGRGGMDGWAVWRTKTSGTPFIDFTHDMLLVHQFHDRAARGNPLYQQEFLECLRLFETMAEDAMTLLNADWLLVNGRLQRPTGFRRLHSLLSSYRPYRFLIGQHRRMRLPQKYGHAARLSRSS